MKHVLSSRERLLSAFSHAEVDHVPLCLKWWSRPYFSVRNDGWKNQFERVRRVTALGLDDTVGFEPKKTLAPEIEVKQRKETLPGENYPLLFKEYVTPKGKLSQIVRQTRDWPHGDDIPMFTDYVTPRSRSKKYLIETMDDLDALSCLYADFTSKEAKQFSNQANEVRRFARENELVTECGTMDDAMLFFLGDALAWLCGLENAVTLSLKQPDLVHRLLDIILEWNVRYLRQIESVGGCDVVVHRGWYECFWSPKLYQTFLAPRIRKEIELVHRLGAKFCYIMTANITPYLKVLKDLKIDVLYGVDPVQGGADLRQVKHEIGDQICLWGGVNSAITLGRGSKDHVQREVHEAMRILAPGGGFILSAIDQLFSDTRWENVQTMIEEWRKSSSV
jgi:uroporphyrinogen-III decarboxylase